MDGPKLRKLRTELGLSQSAFGAKIYASQSQMRDWEQGLYKIPLWAQKNIEREFLASTGEVKPAPEKHIENLLNDIRFLLHDPSMFEYIEAHTALCEDALRERERRKQERTIKKTETPRHPLARQVIKKRYDAASREVDVSDVADRVQENSEQKGATQTGQGLSSDIEKDGVRGRKRRKD